MFVAFRSFEELWKFSTYHSAGRDLTFDLQDPWPRPWEGEKGRLVRGGSGCLCPPPGFLGHCLENLLLEPEFWLTSLEEDLALEVKIQEETLHLIYRGLLMQEGGRGWRWSSR